MGTHLRAALPSHAPAGRRAAASRSQKNRLSAKLLPNEDLIYWAAQHRGQKAARPFLHLTGHAAAAAQVHSDRGGGRPASSSRSKSRRSRSRPREADAHARPLARRLRSKYDLVTIESLGIEDGERPRCPLEHERVLGSYECARADGRVVADTKNSVP